MNKQAKIPAGASTELRAAMSSIYDDLNRTQGRFIGSFVSTDMPLTTDPSLRYCWIWVTDTNKPAWLDPSYPRWQYADGTAA